MVDTNLPDYWRPFKMIPNEILGDSTLSKNAKLVFVVVADEIRRLGFCDLGWTRIGRYCGLERRSVARGLIELVKLGILDVEGGGLRKPSKYHFGTSTTTGLVPKQYQQSGTTMEPDLVPKRYQQDKKRITIREKKSTSSATTSVASDLLGNPIEPEKKTRKPRAPDPVWEAIRLKLKEIFPIGDDLPSEKKKLDYLAGAFKVKLKGASQNEIERRLGNYKATFPTCTASPDALLKHWERCDTGPEPKARPGRLEAPAGKYANLAKIHRFDTTMPKSGSNGTHKAGATTDPVVQERMGVQGEPGRRQPDLHAGTEDRP